jgi:hypothetical protein
MKLARIGHRVPGWVVAAIAMATLGTVVALR